MSEITYSEFELFFKSYFPKQTESKIRKLARAQEPRGLERLVYADFMKLFEKTPQCCQNCFELYAKLLQTDWFERAVRGE